MVNNPLDDLIKAIKVLIEDIDSKNDKELNDYDQITGQHK